MNAVVKYFLVVIALMFLIISCGGGGGSGGNGGGNKIDVKKDGYLDFSFDAATIEVGDRVKYAGALYQPPPTVPPPRSSCNYQFSSDNTSVAVVDSNGEVTGVSPGTANIKVSCADKDAYSDSDVITVYSIASEMVSLQNKLQTLRWLTYSPTQLNPFDKENQIRHQLGIAFSHGFNGVITSRSDGDFKDISKIAKQIGYGGVIAGFDDTHESVGDLVKEIAPYVDAFTVGDNGLLNCGTPSSIGNSQFINSDELILFMRNVRDLARKPVTTSENVEDYLNGGCLNGFLFAHGDWIFPTIFPFDRGMRNPTESITYALQQFDYLKSVTTKFVFVKSTGWPTSGDNAATTENQEIYFSLLKAQPTIKFSYFEGFDNSLPKSRSYNPLLPPDPSWTKYYGLFDKDLKEKLFISRNQP